MLGSFAVGKTSLVKRFIKSIFSEEYLTTVGVKVDKKVVSVGEEDMSLLLWDLHGEDEFQKLRLSYLRGMSAYMLVVDSTRRLTLDHAILLQQNTEKTFGKLPFVLVLNKTDLSLDWDIERGAIESLEDEGWKIIRTSAKTGEGVEETFRYLAAQLL
jgi:small GTP-binding protein